MKANSSRWIHDQFPSLACFAWQEGHGAFSVSASNRDRVAQYIANQMRHHQTRTFAEEFQEFLSRHGIEVASDTSGVELRPFGP